MKGQSVTEIFGTNVFNDAVMKERLPKRALISAKMVRIEKRPHRLFCVTVCLYSVFDISPVYLTRGISAHTRVRFLCILSPKGHDLSISK